MDFANRGTRPAGQENASPSVQPVGSVHKSPKMGSANVNKIMQIVLLFSVTILVAGLIIRVFLGAGKLESSYVDKSKYQAVFLNGGQVYFGKIGRYTDRYLTLTDIFYLRVNQQVQPGQTTATSANDVSLAKLGSELHGPQDQMVMNRSEVQFWENLKDDGQVVKAITQYKKDPSAASKTTTDTTQTGNQQQTNTTPTTTTPTTKKP